MTVLHEPSVGLRELRHHTSEVIARVRRGETIEVTRAVSRRWSALIPDAQRLLDAFQYVPIDEDVVRGAMVEPDPLLRSLDAIHLATARLLGTELTALITYDERLAKAAEAANIGVHTPRGT